MSMKPAASKAGMMNAAAASQPKSGHKKPAAAGRANGSMVGDETRADMKGAMDGTPMDNYPLRNKR